MQSKKIFCCGCEKETQAILTTGLEIYPHRRDLANLPFWKCPRCQNYVGCHHKTKNPTEPLGVIPTQNIRKIRAEIHAIIDPLWKSGQIERKRLYAKIASALDKNRFHTAEVRSEREGNLILEKIKKIRENLID